ncbi:MAG: fumarylacetoacetase, partial [Pseudomonadota bacterium]
MSLLNETHDPKLSSWVTSANLPGTDFPIQNLPFAVFRRKESDEVFRGGVAIGDQVLDLAALSSKNILTGEAQQAALAASGSTLNPLMAMGHTAWSSLRLALSRL